MFSDCTFPALPAWLFWMLESKVSLNEVSETTRAEGINQGQKLPQINASGFSWVVSSIPAVSVRQTLRAQRRPSLVIV